MADWAYYVVLAVTALVVIALSTVEDRNKPLDEMEHKVHKKRAIFIMGAEILVGIALKLAVRDSLLVAFIVLSFMLIAGKVKNCFRQTK